MVRAYCLLTSCQPLKSNQIFLLLLGFVGQHINESWSLLESKQRSKFKWSTTNIVFHTHQWDGQTNFWIQENKLLQMNKQNCKKQKWPKTFVFWNSWELVFTWLWAVGSVKYELAAKFPKLKKFCRRPPASPVLINSCLWLPYFNLNIHWNIKFLIN